MRITSYKDRENNSCLLIKAENDTADESFVFNLHRQIVDHLKKIRGEIV